MSRHRLSFAALLMCLAGARPAAAHHVVWLDFSLWNLGAWNSVNGNNPPTAADNAAVRELVIANMVEDYAPFDTYFTTVQPPRGRYTWVVFLPGTNGTLFGCAGGSCCALGFCTGIGSWDDGVSAVEIYTGRFAAYGSFTGANATTQRIANGISHSASHELGHVLGLTHCHSADDFVDSGAACTDGFGATADLNVNWHIMASGASTGLTAAQRATRDRFFSVHSSRRVLYFNLQPRNHWALLGNVNAGVGRSDLTYGRLLSPDTVEWFNRLSNGASFGASSTWSSDAGNRADLFLTADVTGDGRADLVYGRVLGATTVTWYVRASTGTSFGALQTWAGDAGDAGDIFRLADLDGDGRQDLVYGRPITSTTMRWFARLSTGTSFAASTRWRRDAGNEGNLFALGDADGDGRADLVVLRRGDGWNVYRSTGSSFTLAGEENFLLSFQPDYLLLGDADGDGQVDLVTGTVTSSTNVDWDVRLSDGCDAAADACFRRPGTEWVAGAGDAGDLFRLGDGNGDGRADLFYGRPIGLTSLTNPPDPTRVRWFGRLSDGSSFGLPTTWARDAGDEGDIFP